MYILNQMTLPKFFSLGPELYVTGNGYICITPDIMQPKGECWKE